MYKRNILNIAVILVVTMCLLTFAVSAGALALDRVRQALFVIEVPGDYPTIQAAIDAAEPGDVIRVSVGTYNENLILDKAVTLTAGNVDQINPVNNRVILNGVGGEAAIFIPAGLTQMPVIRGFVIQGGMMGIQAFSPFLAEFNYLHSSVVLVNYEAGSGGLNSFNVYFKAGNDAVHLDGALRPLTIENNRILYSGDDGIEVLLPGASVPPALVEVNIRNNMIIGSTQDGIQFVDFDSQPEDLNRRFFIVGNLFANNGKAGIGLTQNANLEEDYSGADMLETVRVYNNTFFGNNLGISGGDNLVAFNNIITNSVSYGVWRVQGAPGSNSVVAHTLFNGDGTNAGESALGAGVITGEDPLFVAAPDPGPDGTWGTVDDNFSGLLLRPGSPAIDRGVTQFSAANGELIPPEPLANFIGAAPDLGWREFGSPLFMTPTPTPLVFPLFPTPTFAVEPTSTSTPPAGAPTPTAPAGETATPPPPTSTPVTPTPGLNLTVTPPSVTVSPIPTPVVNILKIEPISAEVGTTITLLIMGSGFEPGAQVTFEGGLGIAPQATAVEVVNGNLIKVTVDVQAETELGVQVWDVRVLNLDGSGAVLVDAFTVLLAE